MPMPLSISRDTEMPAGAAVLDPARAKTKGRPKKAKSVKNPGPKRLKSCLELNAPRSSKLAKCN